MKRKTKRFVISGTILVVLIALEQSGLLSLSYSRTQSFTRYSGQTSATGGDSYRKVTIDYPWTRWLPFVKFGETVIREEYRSPPNRDRITWESFSRANVTVFGFMSTEQYENLARRDFEAQVQKRKLASR